MRRKPSNRRFHESIEFEHEGQTFVGTIGYYPEGKPCELFFSQRSKPGTLLDGILYDLGVAISIAIQFGTPLQDLAHSVARLADGRSPASPVGRFIDIMLRRERKAEVPDGRGLS